MLFYSLFIIEFTYCMYIIVNKATFITVEAIKAIIKKSINPINTNSLSDNQSYLVQWQHISTTMFISYVNYYTTFFIKLQANIQNFCKFLFFIISTIYFTNFILLNKYPATLFCCSTGDSINIVSASIILKYFTTFIFVVSHHSSFISIISNIF